MSIIKRKSRTPTVKNKKKLFSILTMFLFMTTLFLGTSEVQAKIKIFTDRNDIWSSEDTRTVRSNIYDAIEDTGSSISANFIYGDTVNLTQYRGEVSSDNKDYYKTNMSWFNGAHRAFSDSGTDYSSDSTDLRVTALDDSNISTFDTIGSGIGNGIRTIPMFLYDKEVFIKNFSIGDILNVFTKGDTSVLDTAKTLFLKDSDGNLSAFIYIFMILYLISFVMIIVNYIKNGGVQNIIKELGFFILAVIVFSIALNTDNLNSIAELSTDVGSQIISYIRSGDDEDDGTNDANIFTSNTGDKNRDIRTNEYGTFAKANIDSSLCSIFNVSEIKDLNISNFIGYNYTTPSFMTDKSGVVSSKGLCVSNGDVDNYNLGYMYWAGQSMAKAYDPIQDNKIQTYSNKNNGAHYYIFDVLNYGNSLGGDYQTKSQHAYSSLLNFNSISYLGSSFGFLLIGLSFVVMNVFIIYLFLEGKLILSIGVLFLIPMPGLILYKGTRKQAANLCRLYIGGFIRLITGQLITTLSLILFYSFTTGNAGLQIFGVAFFCMMIYLMPNKIIPAIEEIISKVEGNEGIARSIHGFNQGMHRLTTYQRLHNRASSTLAGRIAGNEINGIKDKINKNKTDKDAQNEIENAISNTPDEEIDNEIDEIEKEIDSADGMTSSERNKLNTINSNTRKKYYKELDNNSDEEIDDTSEETEESKIQEPKEEFENQEDTDEVDDHKYDDIDLHINMTKNKKSVFEKIDEDDTLDDEQKEILKEDIRNKKDKARISDLENRKKLFDEKNSIIKDNNRINELESRKSDSSKSDEIEPLTEEEEGELWALKINRKNLTQEHLDAEKLSHEDEQELRRLKAIQEKKRSKVAEEVLGNKEKELYSASGIDKNKHDKALERQRELEEKQENASGIMKRFALSKSEKEELEVLKKETSKDLIKDSRAGQDVQSNVNKKSQYKDIKKNMSHGQRKDYKNQTKADIYNSKNDVKKIYAEKESIDKLKDKYLKP